jgi:hypothetical protein
LQAAASIPQSYTLRRLWVGLLALFAASVVALTAIFVYGQLFPAHLHRVIQSNCAYTVQSTDILGAGQIAYEHGDPSLTDYIYQQGQPTVVQGAHSRVLTTGQRISLCPKK